MDGASPFLPRDRRDAGMGINVFGDKWEVAGRIGTCRDGFFASDNFLDYLPPAKLIPNIDCTYLSTMGSIYEKH
jgi:hypothetical protein